MDTSVTLLIQALICFKIFLGIEFGDAVLVGRPLVDQQTIQSIHNTTENTNGKSGRAVQVVGGQQLTTSLFYLVSSTEKKGELFSLK